MTLINLKCRATVVLQLLALNFLFANVPFLQAATYEAASTSRADVLAAVNACSSGDTVNIPAGTSTWSSPITLTKAITINGNGTNNTIIQNNQAASTGYNHSLFNINLS